MNLPAATAPQDATAALLEEIVALRSQVLADAEPLLARFGCKTEADRAGLANLAHYLVLRRHDLRSLQRRLMCRGVSSLGRLEGRVLPTLDAVICALSALAGRPSPLPPPSEREYFDGEARLHKATDRLFGPAPKRRRERIMVTLPSDAAGNPAFILDLAQRGMDVARINCAHDDRAAWKAMTDHIRAAGESVGRKIAVLMDIAGPKIRTETVLALGKKSRLHPGDTLRLVAAGEPRVTPEVPFSAAVSLPELVTRLSVGDRVFYDDGKVECVVEQRGADDAVVRVKRGKAKGTKLQPEKGLNVPDTALGLSPLTGKDHEDLEAVIECADMIGYSFISRPDDIDLLEQILAGRDAAHPLGLVAKIERPEAIRNLPDLIARAVARRPFGIMIARGDLATEIGFERLAEMQEEILWICEAAHVPVIWATQVLEGMVKNGIPSRGEMTDAAMSARAECVMLNKGPAVTAAVELLDGLLTRMDAHVFKKTPTLRALKSW
ncbi:MAG TPA: pyruvate kinase [Dongiaceae bacterium]|nr:pyruvate kinase [Dongiaceae bacterium]